MPTWTERDDLTVPLRGPDPDRPTGLHVTDVIRDMAIRTGLLKVAPHGDDSDDASWTMEVGLLFEDQLELALSRQLVDEKVLQRPKPMCVDNIWMSPDALLIESDGLVVVEYKMTKKSLAKPMIDPTFWMWRMQVGAYCRAVETTLCRFYIVHMVGDYRTERQATPRVVDGVFEPHVLSEQWSAIVNHAKANDMWSSVDGGGV